MLNKNSPTPPEILVVDDDDLLRTRAAMLLEREGFSVVEAENADAALQVLEAWSSVRLLLTDIQMPGALDGLDLARQVHDRWPRIQLIVTSARGKPLPDELPGGGGFVAKPYATNDLIAQIRELLGSGLRQCEGRTRVPLRSAQG